jgi:hypothetical protein
MVLAIRVAEPDAGPVAFAAGAWVGVELPQAVARSATAIEAAINLRYEIIGNHLKTKNRGGDVFAALRSYVARGGAALSICTQIHFS